MERQSQTKKWLYSGAIALGVAVGAAGIASAATNTSTSTAAGATAPSTQHSSNENPAHEKTESAQREADENSGKAHFGGHHGTGHNEQALTGAAADQAKAAALTAVPGATVRRVETDAEGATYEAHVTKADGSEVTVKMDASFKVTATETGHGFGGHSGHRHGDSGAGSVSGSNQAG